MSVGKALLTKENLALVKQKSWKFGRPLIIEQGMRHYESHPDEVARIAQNLAFMGLPHQGTGLDNVLQHIVIHYYEKLFALVKAYESYWTVRNRVEMTDTVEQIESAQAEGKAGFLAQSHFGATYLLGGALTAHGLNPHMVGNYPEPVFGMMRETIERLATRYGAGRIHLLNVALPQTDVPFEMMRLLMTKKIVSNVFDEGNQFCKPVTLLGKTIMGGAGMDLILRRFTDDDVVVLTPYLIRTSDDTFRFEVDRLSLGRGDIIEQLFESLEKRLLQHHVQWYFIQELHHNFRA